MIFCVESVVSMTVAVHGTVVFDWGFFASRVIQADFLELIVFITVCSDQNIDGLFPKISQWFAVIGHS